MRIKNWTNTLSSIDIVTKLSKKYSTKPNSHWFGKFHVIIIVYLIYTYISFIEIKGPMVNPKVPRRDVYWTVITMVENQTSGSSQRLMTPTGNSFGEIKPPHCINTVNKSTIKLAEFMKGSLDCIINIYGYMVGLETYGILICGKYHYYNFANV